MNGLVLIGGASTRMGEDKAFITYHKEPQYLHVYQMLSKYCEKVFVACHPSQVDNLRNVEVLIDDDEYKGPLTGIRSAFNYETTDWLIMPCDMPFLSKKSTEKLLRNKNNSAVICASDACGQINPLVGLYKEECSKKLLSYLGYSPREFVKLVGYEPVDFDTKELVNLNRPKDWDSGIKKMKKSSF